MAYSYVVECICNLQNQKIRTFFTGFSVLWAVVMLVLLQAGNTAFYNGMMRKFRPYVKQMVTIYPGYTATTPIVLTEKFVDSLAHHLIECEAVMPLCRKKSSVVYENKNYEADVMGTPSRYPQIENLELASGRFFNKRDEADNKTVCILGAKMKAELFGDMPAIGQSIGLGSELVSVIGVLIPTGDQHDTKMLIPLSVLQRLFQYTSVDSIVCRLKPNSDLHKTEKKIRDYSARQLNRGEVDQSFIYTSISSHKVIDRFKILFQVVRIFGWFVSCCFMVMGMVSISNIMLVIAKERASEFAIRKIFGATRLSIIALVLGESIFITLLSGAFGVGIGLFITRFINLVLSNWMVAYHVANFEFQFVDGILGLVVSILTGCVAAIIPVKRILSMQPIDALNNK